MLFVWHWRTQEHLPLLLELLRLWLDERDEPEEEEDGEDEDDEDDDELEVDDEDDLLRLRFLFFFSRPEEQKTSAERWTIYKCTKAPDSRD